MTKAAKWTYVSGRVAALEGSLLDAETLERLAGAETSSAAASALAESPLRSTAAEARTPAEAAEAVGLHYAGSRGNLQADCPGGAMFELLALPAAYHRIKDRVRAALANTAGADSAPARISELAGELPAGRAREALELLASALGSERPPEAALALDLLLDSARLLEALELSRSLGSPAVAAHAADEVRVRSLLVVWRSRLVASREGSDSALAEWLPRLFLRGELGSGLAGSLWSVEQSHWAGLIGAKLSESLAGEEFGGGEPERLTGWERAAFNWLTERARDFRSVAFGVERVYGYAWALAVEERNVRLALVGRLRGVKPDAIRELLWQPLCG